METWPRRFRLLSGTRTAPRSTCLVTDALGRDIVARLLFGARLSLSIAGIVLVAGGVTGTLLGMISGYYTGWADEAIMRFVDLTLGVPFILVALVSVIVFGTSLELIIILLVIFSWSGFARRSGPRDDPPQGDGLHLIRATVRRVDCQNLPPPHIARSFQHSARDFDAASRRPDHRGVFAELPGRWNPRAQASLGSDGG